jgi:peptidoglycan/LPS O-acetylase OafA/YrhL
MAATTYRREIDGLRAIAVLAVVFYHATGVPRSGFVGVDIFFVISGYLITGILLSEYRAAGRIDIAAFYARRVRRIFPAFLALTVATLIVSGVLLSSDQIASATYSAASALLFVANMYFQSSTGGYFASRAEETPLLHLWSLSVEEQFYLVWPALLLALLRWRPRLLPLVLASCAIASVALCEWLLRINPQAAFYQMPARFWELALGGMVSLMPVSARRRQMRLVTPALLCVMTFCFIPLGHFPGIGAMPVVVTSALLLCAVHRGDDLGIAGQFLRSSPMVGIGLVSYSFYLWHWPMLAIYRATSIGQGSVSIRLFLCTIALLWAVASYRYIEQPFRRAGWPSKRVLVGAVTVSLVTVSASLGYESYRQHHAGNDNPLALQVENDRPPTQGACRARLYSAVPMQENCETIGGQRVNVVLWGDSMAYAWEPLSDALGSQRNQPAMDYSRAGCGPFLISSKDHLYPWDDKCLEWNKEVTERIKQVDTVILAAFWPTYSTREGELASLLRDTLIRLRDVPNIIILGPTPVMRDSVGRCIRVGNPDACAISRNAYDVQARSITLELKKAASGMRNVSIIDMGDFFCNAGRCPPMKDGYWLYWDSHHVSYRAAIAFAEQYTRR